MRDVDIGFGIGVAIEFVKTERDDTIYNLARRLALALADEATHHGDKNMSEETLEALSVARDRLNLQSEFEGLDSFKCNKRREENGN